jgi:hypothetical protein
MPEPSTLPRSEVERLDRTAWSSSLQNREEIDRAIREDEDA